VDRTDETRARDAMPPQAALYQLAVAHYVPRALYVATTLGIAELLVDGPRPAAELAAATGSDAGALRRVLRLLVTVGVFEELEDGRFAQTPLSDCLRADAPGSARDLVLLFTGTRVQDAWRELEHCVRTGEPVYKLRGQSDPFEEMSKDPQVMASFDAAMAAGTRFAAMAVAATYDFSALGTLVDVGGGNGALLLGILQAHPHLRGVVYDQPAAAERARAAIAAAGLAERCTAMGGDFFASVPEGGDAYLLKHVIHDWEDERAVAILACCRRAMKHDARVLLIEGLYPARADRSLASRGAAANDVNMLVNTGGRQRSEHEMRALYDAAGFTLTRIVPTPANVCVVEGTPRSA
jgi:hypothetical protein